jgi:hypothetical protein
MVEKITRALNKSRCQIPEYEFTHMKNIDDLDVTIKIYLKKHETNASICISYFDISSSIMAIDGNIYYSERFFGNDESVVKLCLEELYRVLPDLKVDNLWGCLRDYIDEGVGTTYVKTDGCCVCHEHTFTKLKYCRHLLCISCQNSWEKISWEEREEPFKCPMCQISSYRCDCCEDDSEDDDDSVEENN